MNIFEEIVPNININIDLYFFLITNNMKTHLIS